MWAAAVAGALVLVAVVVHVRGGHRAELLQSAAGRERRMQALSELGGQSVLWGAERQAFMNGFRAGEQTAEKDVMEDEEAQVEGAKLANLRKALLSQSKEIKQAEDERAMLLSQKAAREAAIRKAEEERAMLLSEKAANYERAWKEAAQKQVEAEALARAHAKDEALLLDRKQAAAARLQEKHAAMTNGALATPGSKRAAELLDFCAQEFGEDMALQKFCYDKLISKPYGDSAILNENEAPKDQVLRERVIDAPTIQAAMVKAEEEGLRTPPQFAELANGELYKVMPLAQALKQHVAQKKAAVERSAMLASGKGGVEVDAPSLKQSVEEAHAMGFKGSPEAVVYHPAHGKPVIYKLESPHKAQELAQVSHAAGQPKELEVDARTLAGSISRAHKMGLEGHPEAIVYHEADGKTELYEAQPTLKQRPAAVHIPGTHEAAARQQIMAEVRPAKHGEVEVEAQTLKQSLAEAHKMGFKGQPTAIVYHPAHGPAETYMLQKNK